MRLTNTLREAFVRAAMNDVPTIDYHAEIGKVVNKYLTEKRIELLIDAVPLDRLKNNFGYFGGQSYACMGLTDAEIRIIN